MSTGSDTIPLYPLSILLLECDPTVQEEVPVWLDGWSSEDYVIRTYDSFTGIQSVDLPTYCHVVVLDLRSPVGNEAEKIRWVGDTQSPVALICICKDHQQILEFEDVLQWVDDCIVPDSLASGEFSARIARALKSRRSSQAQIRDQELLVALLSKIPDAIYFKDRDCRFLRVSDAMAARFGQPAKAMVGQSDFDLFSESEARLRYDDEQRIMRGGDPVLGKVEREDLSEGKVGWMNTTKLPLHDHVGEVLGTMGISRDITPLKEAQDELAGEHRLLQTILNNVPDRVFVKDREGRYLATNQNHMDFLKASSQEEVIGTTTYDHFPQEYADKLVDEDMGIMESRESVINAYEKSESLDGTVSWFLTSKVALLDDDERCIGLVGISREVTEEVAKREGL